MTFVYELDPHSSEEHPIYKYELRMSWLSSRKLSSDRQSYKNTEKQTEAFEIIPRRLAGGQKLVFTVD